MVSLIILADAHFSNDTPRDSVSVRSIQLDEGWVGVDDDPKWTPTGVSTSGINGLHFGASSR